MALPTTAFDSTKTIIPRKTFARFARTALAFAGTAATDVMASALPHLLIDGDKVLLTVTTGLTGLTTATEYYVRDADANSLKLSATLGGAAVNFSADGTGTLSGIVEIVGKLADYEQTLEKVMRKTPGGDGLMRPDRIVAIEHSQAFILELEDITRILAQAFGGAHGGLRYGNVQLWITDPDDAAGSVAVKTNNFACAAELDGGVSFKTGEVTVAKMKFSATEGVTLSLDAVA